MLKIFARSTAKDNLYREVLADAFKLAWQERRFWPLAFFASALLSMGCYDVVFTFKESVAEQASSFFQISGTNLAATALKGIIDGSSGFLGMLTAFQVLTITSIILLTVGAFSCVCQAGLVYGLGAVRRGDRPNVRGALRIGASAIWPVVALNALTLMSLFVLRFLAAFALYLVIGLDSQISWIIYSASFCLFIALSFIVAVVQIFALNAMILQGAPIGAALVRGYELFKKHWLVTIETAALLFVAALITTLAFGMLVVLLLVPFTAMIMTSAALRSSGLYQLLMGAGFAMLLAGAFSLVSFITQLQYSTWTILYRRLGEGGIVAKIHRLYRDLTGTYKIPQS